MKKLPIALAITAITVGSAHAAVTYSSEDFENGTPNYTITGDPLALLQLQDGTSTNITAQTALSGTDYTAGSPSRSGIFANGTVSGVTGEPTGQHAFVSNSSNRSLTLTNGMSLLTDGVKSLTISFDTMVHGLGVDFVHTAAVFYSATGDFADALQIATYATSNALTVPDPIPASTLGHTIVTEDTWSTMNLTLSSTDVTFTDTAKIRFNKLAPAQTEHLVFYDNITITGNPVPEPTTTALLGLAGFGLMLRRRK